MISRPRILLVNPAGHAQSLAKALTSAGYEPVVVADFLAAKAYLDARPDLLITELKLGAYNGLHLAIRASATRTPTIVIGDRDPVLEADAARQGATYLTRPVDAELIVGLVARLLDRSPHTRRSTRKLVPGVEALVNEVPAQLCDVSYEGMRIESMQRFVPPAYFDIRLPQFNFSCRAQRVWTAPAMADETRMWCGAALASIDGETASVWRALVDSLADVVVS